MTRTGEWDFTSAWLKTVVPLALGVVAVIGLQVFWVVRGEFGSTGWVVLAGGAVLGAAYLWVGPRRLVRRASFDGRRLRATTLTGRHDVDVTRLTEVAWNSAGTGATAGWNLFTGTSGHVRHRGGTLLVPMPAGAELLGHLEEARPGASSTGSARAGGDAREFDFTGPVRWLRLVLGVVPLGFLAVAVLSVVRPGSGPQEGGPGLVWLFLGIGLVIAAVQNRVAWRQLVRTAVLDGDRLRARTIDGREHVVDLDDATVSGASAMSRMSQGMATVRHPGGALRLLLPAADELVDRLSAAGAQR